MKNQLLKCLAVAGALTLAAGECLAETQAFSVKITALVGGSSFAVGSPVTIAATVSSNANPIARVDFYDIQHNVILGSSTAAPFATTWKPSVAGSYYLRATGIDSTGTSANSTVVYPINITNATTSTSGSGGTSSGGGTTATTYTVTVVNGTGGGTFAPGASVTVTASTPPAGQWIRNWSFNTAVTVISNNALATTFKMPSANITATANFFTPSPVPFPVTTHPRLWITQNDIARLRSWAVGTNAVFQNLLTVLNKSITAYNTKFYPGGVLNATYPDFGDIQGYGGEISEQHALVFALFARIDPDPNARILHAQRARNLIVYALNEVTKGHLAGAPFRDPIFALFNRANATSEAWPLAVDWIYDLTLADGTPILSASDKLIIRNAFLIWANDCLNAYICGGDHPAPLGVVNSTSLLPGGNAHRVAANNYYSGHARLITLMSLCMDPADDPAVNPSMPAPILGNTLRSYIPNATGAWLYQQYAMFGDPQNVIADLGLAANAKVGLGAGGLSPEGGLYGHSYSYIAGEMLALQTAGFGDPTISGPQSKLINAPMWGRFLTGFMHTMVPAAQVYPGMAYMGPVYKIANYGDVLRIWVTPDFMQVFALLNLLDQKLNNSDNSLAPNSRLDATRWLAINAIEGGAAGLAQRIQNPWSYGVQNALRYFLLLDPAAAAPADPRPAQPLYFFDPSQGRVLARNAWSPSASMFTFRSSWESLNHQDCDAGQIELFRKGEFLTKELSNYDNNGNGQASMWHNTLTLQNWCSAGTPQLNYFEAPYWPTGSQWNNGMNGGDPSSKSSAGPGYVFVETDMTQLYNRPLVWTPSQSATDVQHASRSARWLSPDHIVVYDRATTLHSGLFKRFNLNFAVPPAIDAVNSTAVATMPSGQKLNVKSLRPTGATLTYVPEGGTLTNIGQLETMTGRLVVEDPSKPANVRFLHVLQGTDVGVTADTATLVQSFSGTPYEGALFANHVVMFPVNFGNSLIGTSYSVPVTANDNYVTGLAPGAGFSVIVQAGAAGFVNVTLAPGGTDVVADAAGVVNLKW
jgi:hypothetical protein